MTVHVLDISLSCFVVLCLYPWCVMCVVLIIRLLIELLTLLLLFVFYHTANNDINWTCLIQCFENQNNSNLL